ncbi:hypothetical protein NEHOM01_1789, partial [Nematocida homosporus]|uniref:uncharacterized protein n=1 Tax=Nematocida homosporus TaxID=1912981 RepID=UPI00221ECBC6
STPNSYLSEMLSMIRDKCRCKITIALSVCFKSLVTQHQAYQMKHGQPSSHCNSFQNKPKPKPKDKRIPKRKKACNTTSQPTLDPLKALADLMQYFQFDQAGLVADRHTWDLGDLTSKNVDLLFKALKIMEGVQINYLERITCSFSDKALQPNTDHPNLLIDQMYLLECSEAFVFGLFRVINTTRTQFYIEFPNHKADLSIFLQEVAHLDASRFAIRTSMCSLLINQPVFDRTALDVYIDGMLNLPVLCDSYLLPLDRTLSILEIARLLTWANHEYCRSYDCFIDYAVDVKRHPQLTAFEEDIYSRVPPLPEKNGQADSAFYFLRYVTESQGFYIHYVHRAVNMPLSDELHALAKSNSQGPEIPPVYYPSTLKVTIDSCNESDILYLLGRFMLLIISMRYQPRHLHINGIRLANDRMEIFLEFLYRLDFKERDSLRKPPEHCLSIELTWMDFVTSATTKHILIRPGDSEESEESEESSSSETPPPKPPRGAILPIDCQTATPPIQHLLSIDQ